MDDPLRETYSVEIIEWIISCIKRLTGNVNSASGIKILSNQKPEEIDAQGTDPLYELKETEEHVRVKIFQTIIYSKRALPVYSF